MTPRRKVSLVIIPHSGGRTIEKQFSVLGLRLLIAAVVLVLLAAIVMTVAGARASGKFARYRTLEARNAALEQEVAKLDQLKAELERMKQEDRQIREMLGFAQQPPPIDLQQLYGTLPTDTGFVLDSGAQQALESLRGAARSRQAPLVPSMPPLADYVISRGMDAEHLGVDLVAETGAPVLATADGRIAAAGWDTTYGNSVSIQHQQGYRTFYGHLLRIIRLAGDSVKQGDVIGTLGSTGHSTAPHLHYEVIRNNKQQDPEKYFR